METIGGLVAKANAQANPLVIGLGKDQLDLIWIMGATSFPSNNNQLVIPKEYAVRLSEDNINDLKIRFSEHFDYALTEAFADHVEQVFRIRLAPQPTPGRGGSSEVAGSTSPTASPQSLLAADDPILPAMLAPPAPQLRLPGKKSKVPRPPNAFILYRQKWHSIILATTPGLTNNEISVIVGRQWKDEKEHVKEHFRTLAQQLKEQHALQNPGYQYAPRKPSEKKRRNTARKLSQLNSAGGDTDAQIASDFEMMDVSDNNQMEPDNAMSASNLKRNVNEAASFPFPVSATGLIGSERATYPSHIDTEHNGNLSIMMPTGHDSIESDYQHKMAQRPAGDLLPFEGDERDLVTKGDAYHPLNDEAFMCTLIDWEGLRADAAYIHNSFAEIEDHELAINVAHTGFTFKTLEDELNFHRELDSAMEMFD